MARSLAKYHSSDQLLVRWVVCVVFDVNSKMHCPFLQK